MVDFLIFIGVITLIAFIIPFVLKDEKTAYFIYMWIVIGFPIYILAYIQYWDYTHPMSEDFGTAMILGAIFITALAILLPTIIVIFLSQSFIDIFNFFLIPLIIFFIIHYILFQGYLLYSADNAYKSAKQMQAKNIDTKDMYDFYSPTIKAINITVGKPEKYYRWSYHRGTYVSK